MRPIVLTGEEAHHGPPLVRDVIADGSAERGVVALDSIDDRSRRDRAGDLHPHFAAHSRQRAQVRRQDHAHVHSVCASTDSTAGKSRTARHWIAEEVDERATHTADVQSFVVIFSEPLDWTAFGVWASMLLHRHGADRSRLHPKGR